MTSPTAMTTLTGIGPCFVTDGQTPAGLEGAWTSTECADAFATDFYEILVVADGYLEEDRTRRLAGCLGYALRATICGEQLSEPSVTHWHGDDGARATLLEFTYDSTKSRRDDPDFADAFQVARSMIADGTPIRQTDRAGAGTRGTRLIDGLGPCGLAFYVR